MKHPKAQRSSITTTNWHEVGELKDRSLLSDEMASLCSKYRIYKIEQDRVQDIVTKLSHGNGQGNAIAQFSLHKFPLIWYKDFFTALDMNFNPPKKVWVTKSV